MSYSYRNYAAFTVDRYLDAVQKFAEFFGKCGHAKTTEICTS